LYDDAATSNAANLATAPALRVVRSITSSSLSSSSAMNSALNTSEAAMSICGEADPAWGGRYVHAQAKLYLLIHSIDGEGLQDPEAQRILARLAECSSVSIMATFDKVNTPLLWGSDELARFRWVHLHVPTYQDHVVRSDFALFSGSKGPVGQGLALEYILSSLSKDHTQLVGILASDALQRSAARSAAAQSEDGNEGAAPSAPNNSMLQRGISFEELLQVTSKKLVASTKERLNTLLKELEDHRLLSITGDARRQQLVVMQLSVEQMIKIIEAKL